MNAEPNPPDRSSDESGSNDRRPNEPGPQSDAELDELLDEALDETFPASDPIAVHRHKPENRPPDPTDPAYRAPKEK